MLNKKLMHKGSTFLGVGPMSVNCVNATIELAYEHRTTLMLIASRRQIECEELGGGYVNNWNTSTYSKYVQERDPENRIILARDHGGPWQHPREIELCSNLCEAIESSKNSFLNDIKAGFKILHIDPVISNSKVHLSIECILENIFELYAYCMDNAKKIGKEIYIEIGTEEQKLSPIADVDTLIFFLSKIKEFCEKNNYKLPIYIVVQTGTKVMDRRNIGDFPRSSLEIDKYVEKHNLAKIVELCEKYGIMIKEHNADYLSDESIGYHPKIGIHAANVAPEFGVVETTELLNITRLLGLHEIHDRIISIAVESNKWEKWLVPGQTYSDNEKAIICGHYVFSDERIVAIKKIINMKMNEDGMDLDNYLKEKVKVSIFRYMKNFKMV